MFPYSFWLFFSFGLPPNLCKETGSRWKGGYIWVPFLSLEAVPNTLEQIKLEPIRLQVDPGALARQGSQELRRNFRRSTEAAPSTPPCKTQNVGKDSSHK